MNELTLAIKQNPGTIEMNFNALEEQLDKKLDEYRGAVFTEDAKLAEITDDEILGSDARYLLDFQRRRRSSNGSCTGTQISGISKIRMSVSGSRRYNERFR